jgi:hypothetical protein
MAAAHRCSGMTPKTPVSVRPNPGCRCMTITSSAMSKRSVPIQTPLFHFYRRLLALRKAYPVLVDGMLQPLTFDPRSVLGYLRQNAEQTILVAMNFSGRALPLVLGSEMTRANWELLLSNQRDALDANPGSSLRLAPNEVCILLQR